MPIDELLKEYELAKEKLCPGALLGVRLAVMGCSLVGIDYSQRNNRKKLIVGRDRSLACRRCRTCGRSAAG